MSKFINEKTNEKLRFIVGDKATIVCQTIARLFSASPEDRWIDSQLVGYLCLVFDRSSKASYLRLFHMEEFKLLFEVALYPNFQDKFIGANKLFYYFEISGGFIDEGDADMLKNKVSIFAPKKEEKGKSNKSKEKKGEKIGFFDKLWGKMTGKTYAEDYKIAGPTDVVHESSVKFDFKKGAFDVKNIPSEWKTLFKKAGIEKKHLVDNEYAPMIMEVLLNAYSELEKNENLANIKPSSNNDGPHSQSSSSKPVQNPAVQGGPPAPVLSVGGGGGGKIPQAPVLAPGGGPAAPVLNLNSPSAPTLNLGGPSAPVLSLNKPSAPVLDLNKPSAPVIDLNKPSAPVLDLNKPSAPALDLSKPSAPALDLNKPAGPGVSKSENLPRPTEQRGDMLSQIKSGNFKLKKVENDEKTNLVKVDIKPLPKKAEESLTNTLAAAIAERRKQLMKNNYKEKETSDWSS